MNKMIMPKLMWRDGNEETVLNHNTERKRNTQTREARTEENSKPESTQLQGRLYDFGVRITPKRLTLLNNKRTSELISHIP